MLALAGPSLAKETQPKQETYIDSVKALQYAAQPAPTTEHPDQRMSWFRGSAMDIVDDRDPGLPGQLDTRITFIGGLPGPGVTNELTGGEWTLCSQFPPGPPDPFSKPQCTSDSQIALTGTWTKGEAKWDDPENPQYSSSGIYAGVAQVEGELTVAKGGKVNNKPVRE